MYRTKTSDHAPFFIVGCGRSGTTLLRSMLDCHPLVGVPLESLFIIDYLNSGQGPSVLQKQLPREYELREWGLNCGPNDFADCDTAAKMIDRAHQLYLREHGKVRWGQKTPRFVRYGEILRKHFPGARFVHIVRDPRAVANSLVRSEVHRSTMFHGARRWYADVSAGLDLERNYPRDVLRIHYEKMVANPEVVLRAVCDFLDLEFVEDMLRFHERAPGAYGAHYRQIHSRLAEPVSAAAADAWRKHLDGRDIALVESVCGELMDELGYRRESTVADRPGKFTSIAARLRRIPRIVGQTRHYMTHRSGYLSCILRRKLVLRTLGPVPVNR